MKKILFFIFTFLFSLNVISATNHIYNIDMDIYIDENGTANITEIWHVKGSDGTEWYKGYSNLGKSVITDFKVSMDGMPLTYKKWVVSESLDKKKGYYGTINKTNGVELCFGKSDYKEHKFTLTYKVSNYIFNTDDAQVLYWTLIDSLSGVSFSDYTVEISSYYEFPDTLDVWGFGYKGYAYVEDGVIKMSNEGSMGRNYVVSLVKFPKDTFKTTIKNSKFSIFDDVLKMAKEGSFQYDYDDKKDDDLGPFGTAFTFLFAFAMYGGFFYLLFKIFRSNGFGYKNNKKITKENTPYFRDIPCNKDIYFANALYNINNFEGYNDSNILGAILLKWIKLGKIEIITKEKSFNKQENSLILKQEVPLDNYYEIEFFNMLYTASKDGVLENKELEKWVKKNYSKYLSFFSNLMDEKINELRSKKLIRKRVNKAECKKAKVLEDELYEESKKLYGLKLFLDHFSSINEKEAIEVKLWDEYLMFAYIFGIADKVIKQFKYLYPELINQKNYNFETLAFINSVSRSSVSAASNARRAARSYSSGGGGRSSGGGGRGSSGGGGGGGSR